MKSEIKKPNVSYLPYRGMWQATKGEETQLFYTQEQAEKFAGIEYDSEADAKYWQKSFPTHFN